MQLKLIKTKKDYEEYLNWVDEMFDKKVKPNSAEGQMLQIVLVLIKHYEDEHYPIPVPDPIEAIKVKMEELGLKNKDLVGKVGQLAKIFHRELGIPAEVLLS